jgi:uncharacterized membrane protein YccC
MMRTVYLCIFGAAFLWGMLPPDSPLFIFLGLGGFLAAWNMPKHWY